MRPLHRFYEALFLEDTIAKVVNTFFTTSGDTITADPHVVMVYKQVLHNNPAYRVVTSTPFTYKCNGKEAFTSWIVDGKYMQIFTEDDWETRADEVYKARHALDVFKKIHAKDLKDDFRRATGRHPGKRKSRDTGSKGHGGYGYGKIAD